MDLYTLSNLCNSGKCPFKSIDFKCPRNCSSITPIEWRENLVNQDFDADIPFIKTYRFRLIWWLDNSPTFRMYGQFGIKPFNNYEYFRKWLLDVGPTCLSINFGMLSTELEDWLKHRLLLEKRGSDFVLPEIWKDDGKSFTSGNIYSQR